MFMLTMTGALILHCLKTTSPLNPAMSALSETIVAWAFQVGSGWNVFEFY
jgi:hypothetical protein